MPADQWERLLTAGLARDFEQLRIDFLARVRGDAPMKRSTSSIEAQAARIDQFRQLIARARTEGQVSAPMLAQIAGQARILLGALGADRLPSSSSGLSGAVALGVRCEAEALVAARREVAPLPWTEAHDLSGFDLVLPLVAWGYHLRFDALARFPRPHERDRLAVINPPALLRWNSDKAYLAELADAGVSTVPTLAVEACCDADLEEARRRFGSDWLVIKPPVSASATGTHRLGPSDDLPPDSRGRPMIVQPLIDEIASTGEFSLMLFDGQLSHTVVKRPKSGDFRVQPHLGGITLPLHPRRPARRSLPGPRLRRHLPRDLRAGRHRSGRRRGLAHHGAGTDRASALPGLCPGWWRGIHRAILAAVQTATAGSPRSGWAVGRASSRSASISGHKRIYRAAAFPRRIFERAPEHGFQADGRLHGRRSGPTAWPAERNRAPPSVHVLAAVDRQRRASDEAAILVDQECDPAGDLLGLAEAPDWDPSDDLAEHFLRHRGDHVGVDVPRSDGVDRDAVSRAFLRQRLGEAVDAGLGGGIIDLPVLARLAVDRADVDDAAVATADHAVEHGLCHVEAAAEVRIDHVLPLLVVHSLHRRIARDSGVVDQHVDRPELRFDLATPS